MSVFASAGQKSKHKIQRVKGVLEHLSLYVGLAIYTALGAKVGVNEDILRHFNNTKGLEIGLLFPRPVTELWTMDDESGWFIYINYTSRINF